MGVTGCEAVYVDCHPGFPLTIRLHQTEAARELSQLAGYPVVDTTGRLGHLCSGGTDQAAVNLICRMMGHNQVTSWTWTLERLHYNLTSHNSFTSLNNDITITYPDHLKSYILDSSLLLLKMKNNSLEAVI